MRPIRLAAKGRRRKKSISASVDDQERERSSSWCTFVCRAPARDFNAVPEPAPKTATPTVGATSLAGRQILDSSGLLTSASLFSAAGHDRNEKGEEREKGQQEKKERQGDQVGSFGAEFYRLGPKKVVIETQYRVHVYLAQV